MFAVAIYTGARFNQKVPVGAKIVKCGYLVAVELDHGIPTSKHSLSELELAELTFSSVERSSDQRVFERTIVGLEDLDLLVLGSDDVEGGVGEGFEGGIELVRQAGDEVPAR